MHACSMLGFPCFDMCFVFTNYTSSLLIIQIYPVHCKRALLEDEIEYVKPNMIFIFSTRTWEAFYTHFNNDEKKIELIGKEPKELKELEDELKDESKENREKERRDFLKKVTKVHGLPFELTKFGHKIIVIPLCHFSPRCYNNLIQDSYFRYFSKSLEENRKIIKSKISTGHKN